VVDSSTDWVAVYCRLQYFAIADPLLQAGRFGKVPIKFLMACLKNLSKEHQQNANATSVASAKLGMVVISALGGKNAKAKVQDFLPFEMPKDDTGLSTLTITAMKWALKNETLHPAVVGMLGAELG
jgi:hypothetical protein